MSEPVLKLEGLGKTFNQGTALEARIIKGINLEVFPGELCALTGSSGSGKSTLLNLIGLLDTPTEGELYIQSQATRRLSDTQRTHLRNHALGFIFQFHHLINAFSVLDNVLMPLILRSGKPSATHRAKAMALLEHVGLSKHIHKFPNQLSGGQQQRVAIARALITEPPLLLADEPTGNLDSHTADEIFSLFEQLNRTQRCAMIIVTHDPKLAQRCPRQLHMQDGCLI